MWASCSERPSSASADSMASSTLAPLFSISCIASTPGGGPRPSGFRRWLLGTPLSGLADSWAGARCLRLRRRPLRGLLDRPATTIPAGRGPCAGFSGLSPLGQHVLLLHDLDPV